MGGNTALSSEGLGESQQSFMEGSEAGQQAQDNIGNTLQGAGMSLNSGLTQNDMGDSQLGSMSNDLVASNEETDGRQMIGNGKLFVIS